MSREKEWEPRIRLLVVTLNLLRSKRLLAGVKVAEIYSDGQVRIADHWICYRISLCFLNIFFPFQMALDRVYAKSNDLAVPLLKLGYQFGHIA